MKAAKLRAARLLWSRIVDEFNPKKASLSMLRTHCQTSGVSLQEQDPYNNIVRTAYEALSGALGGTQSLHTNSFDEAIALLTEFSARIARNTQLILQHETGVTKVVDPLAGSYYVESLTAELADKTWALIEEAEIETLDRQIGPSATARPGGSKRSVSVAIPRSGSHRDAAFIANLASSWICVTILRDHEFRHHYRG
ncbi:methylmalonyl-CoA mutase cobalamin-binding domain/chain [Sinorhizobium americanum]|uniref:methylmalonyl-CoA mutase n=1 Tax=Sinorhizobium americanum TaxID=194963 RepID=A0A4R2B2K9_9HYPH|nr:methylmalonyl-CoA mutase cobalamin-binding domain/chain [Sinorhizobium americanum]